MRDQDVVRAFWLVVEDRVWVFAFLSGLVRAPWRCLAALSITTWFTRSREGAEDGKPFTIRRSASRSVGAPKLINRPTRRFVSFEIRQQLLRVRSGKLLHALHFDNDPIIHDEIHAASVLEDHAVVFEANGPLSLAAKLVNGFQQAGSKITVNTERGIHDHSGDVIQFSQDASSPPRVCGSA